ncbi:MAG: response regulator [Eubacterium sp.]|nr:response regulator [Eubacterium sp.]
MKAQNKIWSKIVKYILGMMLVGSFVFFFAGQILLPTENDRTSETFRAYEGKWEQVLPDGSREEMQVPGDSKVAPGEWASVVTMLPQELDYLHFCIRSMQQEMKIYVDDILRKEYSTLDTQPVGTTSTMTYVFFEVSPEDAGKELRIELMSKSGYAGYVSDVYIGKISDIYNHFYHLYLPSAIVAAFMFLISLFVIGGCLFIQIYYKKKTELLYLGQSILIAASWLLVESKLRQFFLPNSTIAMLMGFLMIAILPYPLQVYLDSIQGYRYQKIYHVLEWATAINFAAVVSLQSLQIKDFYETMMSSHIIIIALIVTIAVTLVLDILKKKVCEYREVAIGFAILMLMGIFEIVLVYTINARLNGIFLCVGLVTLLIASALKTLREMFNVEKEKQRAIVARESSAKFLANMSHEIRTPINAVIGMNEMILRESTEDQILEYAYNVKSSSQMLLSLINDVLDFSKIEAGKLVLVESEYEPAMLFRDVIYANQIRMEQKGLLFHIEIDEQLPSRLQGDDVRLKQILNNLLSNAAKYTEQGSVTFSARGIPSETGFVLELSVTDTGIGIKQEDLEKLFSSFQRLELAKNRYIEGTGLGLNIVKQLSGLMGGTVDVQSEYGKGSCFTVRVPQVVIDKTPMGSMERIKDIRAREKTEEQPPLEIPDAKVLVVDDNPTNLTVVEHLLARTKVQLDMARSGTRCFKMTKAKKYDLILMDHMMPDPDGIATFHMIREDVDNKNRTTPIIVLTANAMSGMKEQYLKEGFSDYLSKPIDAEALEKMLADYLL